MINEKSREKRPSCGLAEFPQLETVPAEVLDRLDSICRIVRYSAGQIVIDADDPQDVVACVKDGYLRMQKTLADGRQHIVGLLVEGDMFGRVFGAAQTFDIEAATDVEMCVFSRPRFEEILLDCAELERVVMLNILNELDRARDWMVILACQKVTGRLAGFLLVLCTRFANVDHVLRRHEDGLEVFIPISRADLAHLLGARAESISRAFHALEDAGTISIIRPDLVRIRDIKALAAEAGDEDIVDRINVAELVRMARRSG